MEADASSLIVATLRPEVFKSSTKAEDEKIFLQLLEQTGLNPKVPDLRKLRDASGFQLVIPGRYGAEQGVLHLTYEIYNFKDDVPRAVLSDVEFISLGGHKVSIEKSYLDERLQLHGPVEADPSYTFYASLEGAIVTRYMRFIRPFASSRMSDGSMIPAHNLRHLSRVRSLEDAIGLRRFARLINMKNFLIEACKRYGLYTLLGLTGIRQFFIILSRDRPEEKDEEIDKLKQQLSALLAEKRDLQITEEKFHHLDAVLKEQGREMVEDERGVFYILRKVSNHYEPLVEGDLLPNAGSLVESTQGIYRRVRYLDEKRIVLESTKDGIR